MARRVSLDKRDKIIVLQFVLPGLVILFLFVFYPIFKSIIMSFQTWNLISPAKTHSFIGFENYRAIFNLSHFSSMIGTTLLYTFVSVAGKMVVGLMVALLLNHKFHGRAFVRGLMLIPWAMPTVVVCNTFLISLDPNYGILTAVLEKLPFVSDNLEVFSNKTSALVAILLISIWKNFPFISLMLLAALGSIPNDYYDAASIDGANIIVKFKSITWPQIKSIWNTLLVLQILWTVKEFELIYLITKGGPDNATNVIGIDIYLNAFKYYKVGMASAEGVLLLVFCMIFAIVYFHGVSKEEQR